MRTLKVNLQKKYHSDIINELVRNNIELFLNYFNIKLNSDSKKYYGPCPIHLGSDNPQAFVLYKNSSVWSCFTHGCHNHFKKTPAGLIQALLSSQKLGWAGPDDTNKIQTFEQTSNFIEKFLNKKTIDIINNPKNDILIIDEKRNFIRQSNLIKKNTILSNIEQYKKYLKESKYFLDRGFSKEILIKYNVGILDWPKHEFHNKNVIPILDYFGNYVVGLTARIDKPKCLVCGFFHEISNLCLDKNNNEKSYKWLHSFGFNKNQYLFNYSNAQNCIKKTNTITLVEGPLDCLKLEMAGICNSLAIFGSNLSQSQSQIIKKSNIRNINIITDNDEGGELAAQQIKKTLGNQFIYNKIDLEKNDIAEMKIDEIQYLLKNE